MHSYKDYCIQCSSSLIKLTQPHCRFHKAMDRVCLEYNNDFLMGKEGKSQFSYQQWLQTSRDRHYNIHLYN